MAFALAVGGAAGAVSQFRLERALWVWPMPDLAYRFLAAAATAYVAGGVYCLVSRKPGAAELLSMTVLLYGVPLVGAVIWDRDVIDWGRPVAWEFVVIVSIAMAIAAGFVVQQVREHPTNGWRQDVPGIFFVVLGVAATLVGVLVFFAPKQAAWAWPWAELAAWKPLDIRLIASMLITIGLGAAWFAWRRRNGMAELFTLMLVGYAVVAAIGLWKHARVAPAFKSEDYTYAAVFVAVAAAAVVVVALDRGRKSKR